MNCNITKCTYKFILQVVFLCLVAVAAAAELPPIPILRQAADFKEDGTYSHR